MNRLLAGIAEFLSSHPVDEKVLVVPSLAVGRQIIERLAIEGYAWINLRVETVRTLAMEVVGADLASQGKKLLSRAQSLALIEQACANALDETGYFGKLKDQKGLHRAMQQTIEDLRASSVSLTSIPTQLLESEQKATEIRAVADAFEQSLNDGSYVDRSDILRLALDRVRSAAQQDHTQSLYLVPDGLDSTGIEHEFLAEIAGGNLHTIPSDDPATWSSNLTSTEIEHALGEENEIRGIFRAIIGESLPLDSVEIIYTDTATYIPLITELCAQYGVPCTSAQGIPVTFSRPGQAAVGFLDWLAGGYDASTLRKVVAEGSVNVASGDSRLGALAASRVIRDAQIGWGRERHLLCMDRLIAGLERKSTAQSPDDDDVDTAILQERLRNARAVRAFIERLLELSEAALNASSVDCAVLARALLEYLSQFASVETELDGLALKALQSMLGELTDLPQLHTSLSQAVERLREAVTQTFVNASTPRPGHIHVSDYKTGGYSGRRYTYVVGLDEVRFPGGETQDPVLLDSERSSINETSHIQLPLLADRPGENVGALRACLARLRGKAILSFSSRSLLDDREQFPSSIVLEAFRLRSDEPDADYSRLLASLPPPSGFISSNGRFLDDVEWWLTRLKECNVASDGVSAAIRSVYPWLECGYAAERSRDDTDFGVFDGLIGAELTSTPAPLSASRLEALAKCPFAYFVRHVLGITPVADRKLDPTRWLDAMEYGTLLHDIFRRFMERITARREKPSLEAHKDEITEIAQARISEQTKLVPPPNAAAFKAQCDDILRTCLIFLKMEQEHCLRATPRFFEVPFGSTWGGGRSVISDSNPVTIRLDNGGTFTLTGRIDRIDEDLSGNYQVWDYKTGSTWGVKEESTFDRGRQLQHALYAFAVNELLRRAGIEGRVSQSGYFFPALRGEGQRIRKQVDEEGLRAVLGNLHEILSNGAFLSTDDSGMCAYCDLSSVCGPEAVTRSKAKLEAGSGTLDPIRRLINDHR